MILSSVTFVIAFSVSIVNAIQHQVFPNGSQDLSRYEQQPDQKWTWGAFGDLEQPNKERESLKEPVTLPPVDSSKQNDDGEEKNDPCLNPLPVKPDFNVPGRRISVAKCYEYIWQIKYRETVAKDKQVCTEYRKKHPVSGLVGTAAIGGRDAKPGEFPHMGALGWKATKGTWVFKCGGTLISEKYVLTAAHCSKAADRNTDISDTVPKIVRFGDKNIIDVAKRDEEKEIMKHLAASELPNSFKTRVSRSRHLQGISSHRTSQLCYQEFANGIQPIDAFIAQIIVHPQYKSPMKYDDIALIELEFNLEFNSNVQPACLWNSFDVSKLGKEAAVTGWGIFESGGRKTSPVLQIAVVDFIDSSTCDSLLRPMCNRHWCGINDTQICAGKLAGGVDACQGDSGGPLSVRIPLPVSAEGAMHHVVGITSFGFGCALKDTPGVYTRVSSFVPWIESIVWPS